MAVYLYEGCHLFIGHCDIALGCHRICGKQGLYSCNILVSKRPTTVDGELPALPHHPLLVILIERALRAAILRQSADRRPLILTTVLVLAERVQQELLRIPTPILVR